MYFCSGFLILQQAKSFKGEQEYLIDFFSRQLIEYHYPGAKVVLTHNKETDMQYLTISAYLEQKGEFEKNLNHFYDVLMNKLGFSPFGILYCHDSERFQDSMYSLVFVEDEISIDNLILRMDPFLSPMSQKLGSNPII